MSEFADAFMDHLEQLRDRAPGALAALRHSLAFTLGAYPPAYPYVERFVKADAHAQDASRLALYLVAGLFAKHPVRSNRSFAASFGTLMHKRGSDSIEKRFIALLGADPENLADYLRQAVSLLAADGIGLNYRALLTDATAWLNLSTRQEWRDQVRQRWARDFYRAVNAPDIDMQEVACRSPGPLLDAGASFAPIATSDH